MSIFSIIIKCIMMIIILYYDYDIKWVCAKENIDVKYQINNIFSRCLLIIENPKT